MTPLLRALARVTWADASLPLGLKHIVGGIALAVLWALCGLLGGL